MDNLIKPILDSLVGIDGIVLDDSLLNSVEINWQDKNGEDEFEITIEYPELLYSDKNTLFFLKQGQWCFPCNTNNETFKQLVNQYFSIWNKIIMKIWGFFLIIIFYLIIRFVIVVLPLLKYENE